MEDNVSPEEPQAQDRRVSNWWWRAFLPAFAVVYGPFNVAAGITWLFVSCNHCKLVWLKCLWIFPGMLLTYLARTVAQNMGLRSGPVSETAEVLISGLLSAAIVFGIAWIAGRGRVAKWLVLPLALALSAWGAFAAFHLVRA